MEFQEFIVYVLLSLLGIIIVLGILNLVFNVRIVKRFSGKFVKILANYELQSEDLSSLFTVTFFNNNMADIKLHSFGFMYCNEQVDFYEEYVKNNYPDLKKKLIIEPADSVKLQLPYERMKNMLLAIRNDRSSLQRIYGYIVDSNGNQSTKSLKDIHKNVKRIFKTELKNEKEQRKEAIRKAKQALKEEKLRQKEERKLQKQKEKEERQEKKRIEKEARKKKRAENNHKRKESLKKFWIKMKEKTKNFFGKFKNIFSRKKESE